MVLLPLCLFFKLLTDMMFYLYYYLLCYLLIKTKVNVERANDRYGTDWEIKASPFVRDLQISGAPGAITVATDQPINP